MKIDLMSKALLQLFVAGAVSGLAVSRSAAVVQSSTEVWVGSCATVQGATGASSKVNIFSQRMVQPLQTAAPSAPWSTPL